ncbi:hypothetical protein BVRB_5g103610 [Beta vulgaris subsp. vulgaris]|nr:hypothetical protein BVRB_5g103610 [Beta vulgaris subsp. vulgaris]
MLRFYVCELLSEFIDLPVTETGPHKSERRRRYCPKISNGSHCSEDNGCEKYDTSDIQQDASAALLEPSADGVLDNDDSRPLKKAKSVDDDEIDSSKDVNNALEKINRTQNLNSQLFILTSLLSLKELFSSEFRLPCSFSVDGPWSAFRRYCGAATTVKWAAVLLSFASVLSFFGVTGAFLRSSSLMFGSRFAIVIATPLKIFSLLC